MVFLPELEGLAVSKGSSPDNWLRRILGRRGRMVTCRTCKRDGPHHLGDDHEGAELENGVMALPLLKEQGGGCPGPKHRGEPAGSSWSDFNAFIPVIILMD